MLHRILLLEQSNFHFMTLCKNKTLAGVTPGQRYYSHRYLKKHFRIDSHKRTLYYDIYDDWGSTGKAISKHIKRLQTAGYNIQLQIL